MKQLIALVLLSCLLISSNAQDNIQLLEKVVEHYTLSEEYKITSTYSLYRGHTRAHISEQYKSLSMKKENRNYVKALNAEVIQEADLRLVIDHSSKSIYYQEISTDQPGQFPINLKGLLTYYTLVSTQEQEGIKVLELHLKNEQIPIDYSTVKLYIDANQHKIVKQELFSNKLNNFYNEDGSSQKEKSLLVIEFEEEKRAGKVPSFSDYIKEDKEAQLLLNPQYSTYQIIEN